MPGGNLAVPNGDQIIPTVYKLIRSNRYDKIVATLDWHPPTHKSFASQYPDKKPFDTTELSYGTQVLWPDHCVRGTAGVDMMIPNDLIHFAIKKGSNPEIDSYSGFFENDRTTMTQLHQRLTNTGITELDVVGLALDYCVKYTAIDAAGLGYKVNLIPEGTRAIANTESTYLELLDRGVCITPISRLI